MKRRLKGMRASLQALKRSPYSLLLDCERNHKSTDFVTVGETAVLFSAHCAERLRDVRSLDYSIAGAEASVGDSMCGTGIIVIGTGAHQRITRAVPFTLTRSASLYGTPKCDVESKTLDEFACDSGPVSCPIHK